MCVYVCVMARAHDTVQGSRKSIRLCLLSIFCAREGQDTRRKRQRRRTRERRRDAAHAVHATRHMRRNRRTHRRVAVSVHFLSTAPRCTLSHHRCHTTCNRAKEQAGGADGNSGGGGGGIGKWAWRSCCWSLTLSLLHERKSSRSSLRS